MGVVQLENDVENRQTWTLEESFLFFLQFTFFRPLIVNHCFRPIVNDLIHSGSWHPQDTVRESLCLRSKIRSSGPRTNIPLVHFRYQIMVGYVRNIANFCYEVIKKIIGPLAETDSLSEDLRSSQEAFFQILEFWRESPFFCNHLL